MQNQEELREQIWNEFQEKLAECRKRKFYYSYRVTLLEGYQTDEESDAEWKKLIENKDSKDSAPMTEAEKELSRKQLDVVMLEGCLTNCFFPCWLSYTKFKARMQIEQIKQIAASIERKKRREKEKVTEEDEKSQIPKTENETSDNETAGYEEMIHEAYDDEWFEYPCSLRAAKMLGEVMGDLPRYEEWLKTFDQA